MLLADEEQESEVVNRRIVSESEGGVSSTITWVFEPEDAGTRVSDVADYSVNL